MGSQVGSFPSLPALAGSEPGFVLLSEKALPELTGREDEVYLYHFKQVFLKLLCTQIHFLIEWWVWV